MKSHLCGHGNYPNIPGFTARAAVKLLADRQEKKTIFFVRPKNLLKQLCPGPKFWGYQCNLVGSAHSSSFLTRSDSSEMFAEPQSTTFFVFFLSPSSKFTWEETYEHKQPDPLQSDLWWLMWTALCALTELWALLGAVWKKQLDSWGQRNPIKFNKYKILHLGQGTHQYNDDGIESSPEEKGWEIPVDEKLDMSW